MSAIAIKALGTLEVVRRASNAYPGDLQGIMKKSKEVASGSEPMQTILLSREEVARRARQLYESSIREQVEVAENIGKMVIIDIETGDRSVAQLGYSI